MLYTVINHHVGMPNKTRELRVPDNNMVIPDNSIRS